VDPQGSMQIRYKPEETPVTLAAKESYLGRVYLSWAQYPITETEELTPGIANNQAAYRVRFRDLRYAYPGQSPATLGAYVLLTRDLKVISEEMGMRGNEKKPH
jgi:inner membrane protein